MVLTHVERALRQYCQPDEHHFGKDGISFDFERCRTCGRRQRIDGNTCTLCDGEGVSRYALENGTSGATAAGRLCAECARELAFRGAVHGWAIRLVRAA